MYYYLDNFRYGSIDKLKILYYSLLLSEAAKWLKKEIILSENITENIFITMKVNQKKNITILKKYRIFSGNKYSISVIKIFAKNDIIAHLVYFPKLIYKKTKNISRQRFGKIWITWQTQSTFFEHKEGQI